MVRQLRISFFLLTRINGRGYVETQEVIVMNVLQQLNTVETLASITKKLVMTAMISTLMIVKTIVQWMSVETERYLNESKYVMMEILKVTMVVMNPANLKKQLLKLFLIKWSVMMSNIFPIEVLMVLKTSLIQQHKTMWMHIAITVG